MAKARDIEPLMAKAITDKARSLRPSPKDSKHIDAKDTGILLGNLQGSRHEVRMGFEDVAVAIMAPRSGKTTSLAIPSMLGAPGPVLLTSNKAAGDAFTTAYEARARAGAVWTMDPQQIAHAAREMWWNPLASATTLDGANRLAGHFLAASVDASQQGDFWSKAGSSILSQLLLAAALDERPITDIMQWLAFPADRTPLDFLRDHDFAAVAAQLKGTVEGPPETRDGIYETARQYASALLNAEIAAWVTPQKPCRRRSDADVHRRGPPLVLVPAQQQPDQRHRPSAVRAGWHALLRAPRERVHLDRRARLTADHGWRRASGSRAPIRVTAREAGLLQTFPADYPWAGNKGQQFSQIGNAVPPLLAGHLLAPHLGVTLDPDDFALAA